MHRLDAGLVQRGLDRIRQRCDGRAPAARQRRGTRQVHGDDVVRALELGKNRAPAAPRQAQTMERQERVAASRAMADHPGSDARSGRAGYSGAGTAWERTPDD
jgi:hypothetical protein